MLPEIGSELRPWRLDSVSPDKMKALAEVLQDPNPIHLDPAAVERLGLGRRVINQGPANLAYLINMLKAALPGARIVSLQSRFMANVFGGDAVEAGGRVTAREKGTDGVRLTCELWLRVNDGDNAVVGEAVVLLPHG